MSISKLHFYYIIILFYCFKYIPKIKFNFILLYFCFKSTLFFKHLKLYLFLGKVKVKEIGHTSPSSKTTSHVDEQR